MGVNGIYGLSGSGLDIESLVKMGMSGKNKQYDKMEQKEIANTWLKEAYNDVYNDLTTYKYGTLSTYKMQSNLNAMAATSSNTGVVTATANGAAAAMNHTVTVESVASNAYLLTAQDSSGNNYGITRANADAQTSNKLADVIFGSYSVASYTQDGNNFNFTYNVNGQEVNGSDVAISLRLKDTAGSDTEYTLTYTYDELFTGVKSGEYTGYTGDQSALFDGGKTLNDLASAVAKTGANIQGGYDTVNESFSLYNKTSGKDNVIGITADNANTATLLNHLNLGSYNSATNELSDRINFAADNTMATTMESSGITNSAKSVSMRDVLGLSAKSVSNGDGSYTVTVKDNNGDELGSFIKNADGTYTGADDVAFSMNLSNGTNGATVSFTLGELFNLDDIGKKTNLGGNAGLSDLADKINATGIGVTASYDAANDSFSLTNPTGQAELTANTGTGEAVATQLINSLNLATSTSLYAIGTSNTSNLADIFGLNSTIRKTSTNGYSLRVLDGSTEIGSQSGNRAYYANGTDSSQTLFSFKISDGTDSTTVDVSYGDIVDYSAFVDNGYNLKVNDVEINYSAGTLAAQASSANLSALAAKINEACENAGLNIKASYVDGDFTIANPNGEVYVNNIDGSPLNVSGKLNLGEIADPSGMTFKSSTGITRVNEHSTEDSLADGLGLSAVKNNDGTLTVTDADGNSSTVNASDTAFAIKVGDSGNQAEVSFTYEDLFDTSGTGNLKSSASLSTMADKINEVATANSISVTAAYDGATGKFTLSNDSGYATLTGSDTLGSSLVAKMGLTESSETAAARDHTWAGTNASVTIDGKSYDNSTNKLTVAGVTYTFLDSTQAGQKATVTVNQDTDKIVDYMKSFVEDYNKLLDSLNEKLAEKKYSDYLPLSSRQEDEMTEKQIEKWNEKAKSGLLYHNSTIQELVSAMREAIYTKVDAVDSQYNTLSSIGITSTNTKGHLTIDTDKLKTALAADPDCVYQLFASDQDSTYIAGSTNKNKITASQQREDYANTGVANRLYNVMTNSMSKISDIAGTSKETDDQSYLGKLITDMKTRMSTFKTQMTAYENKLFKRYDAMEVALARLNMQLGYLSSSFS
ncbi:flagellar filament capping protein FliD [Anaerovibrio sp.]|uniref:flagellar filament capping protein FliD n=1 Tax=Anaerovibrio sp. TaxID=1872532 RepID=UPI0025BE7C82|nr:flagellar filament capping protein FliD [Anaerovibrio sp.]MBR2142396.1 flagellar filament capping protein FliD [Anaerovibrio sp.]